MNCSVGFVANSSHSRVAVPLNLCHLASDNIDIERTVAADSAFFVFQRNDVVTGRQRDAEPALVISREGCDGALFVFHDESRVRKRLRTRNARSDRPAMSRTDSNHALDACGLRRGCCLRLRPGKTRRHKEEDQN